MRAIASSVFLVLAVVAALPLQADVKLPPVLSSHMVLQGEMPVPVWGQAAPGEQVTVSFRDQKKAATADKDGKWQVKLDALKAGGPDNLTVSGNNSVTLEDVLVGEVWVGSGQSNMAGAVNGYAKGDPVLASLAAAAPYPRLRLLKVSGGWQEATENNINGFSALLFGFGAPLQKELDVPVGLILGAVGGTPSGAWLSPEMLAADEPCQKLVQQFSATYDKLHEKYEQDLAKWKEAAEAAKKDGKNPPPPPADPGKPGKVGQQDPGYLYKVHIQPAVPFAIRGVLWDQGESGTKISGIDQYTLMGALIRGWRSAWGQGDFAFLYVQKPSGGGCVWDPTNAVTNQASPFAPLPPTVPANGQYVENHVAIMRYPNTMMVTSTDLGAMTHPTNKSGYGHRASDAALATVYGRKIEYIGPVYDSHQVDGERVRIKFQHVGRGLAQRHGDKLQGFAVAGEDRVFQWADAKIDGDAVVVSSAKVPKPVAVRYAWSQTHPWANLFNQDGLPAITFRTDTW